MKIVFWASLLLVFYAYAGYPFLLLLWPFKKRTRRAPQEPSISILIAVRNEARVIAEKIRHLQGIDYPPQLMQIIVVSDGSTDSTVERSPRLARTWWFCSTPSRAAKLTP